MQGTVGIFLAVQFLQRSRYAFERLYLPEDLRFKLKVKQKLLVKCFVAVLRLKHPQVLPKTLALSFYGRLEPTENSDPFFACRLERHGSARHVEAALAPAFNTGRVDDLCPGTTEIGKHGLDRAKGPGILVEVSLHELIVEIAVEPEE